MRAAAVVLLASLAGPLLGQAADLGSDLLAPLISSGPIGLVLAWFMLRNERRMRSLTAAVDRLNRASMLMVITSKRATDSERDLARGIIDEIDRAQKDQPVGDE